MNIEEHSRLMHKQVRDILDDVQEYLNAIDGKIIGLCVSRGIDMSDIKPSWNDIKKKYLKKIK